ncbi:MAG: spore coat polysaccharide biosynthesis protein SpsC [Candidatus Binatia bacterium]|nr:MAG: spore coat polysaccharide biosynthesis protein SpsC [Candidatus Binatia bacterium]
MVTGSVELGSRARKEIPFHRPSLGDEEVAAVVETLRTGWITMGPKTREFESAFAEKLGAAHAVAVSSCTAALHLALDALGVAEGDEVIVPTYTFTATGAVVLHCGARLVLADCEPDTLNIDPADVERKVTKKTRAIVPVHFAGHPASMDRLLEIADARGIAVVEDAAHALPASYRGRRIGTIGRATAFSFYATKNMTTGEGGMLTTGDEELAARVRTRRLHGLSYDAWNRYSRSGSWRYDVLYPGFKYNTTDLNAAIGLVQLARLADLQARRNEIVGWYTERLRDVPGLRLPTTRDGVEHAWHLYVVRIEEGRFRVTRDEVIERLRGAGIGTSVHFVPLHLHTFYRETFGWTPEDFPVATRAAREALSLPLYPTLTEDDVDYVTETLKGILLPARS